MLIADFHIHSKYSRACSKELTLPNIARACERKGIDLCATSDITHPAWRAHIEDELEEVNDGIFQLRGGRSKTKFILATEISSIYSQGGKVRRVHELVLLPTLADVRALCACLEERGCNLKADGRPIIGVSAQELLRIMLDITPRALMVPAHAWTPWFSVFGSKSGFDSLEACFGDLTPHVRAIETGLSSDPTMNARVTALDNITLISNSDAHSLDKLGREATVFSIDPNSTYTYDDITRAIAGDTRGVLTETIEFFPEEGKYHVDGHATCNFSCDPLETKKYGGICPVCNKPLTIGVLHRVQDLADRTDEQKVIHSTKRHRKIIPLAEIIAFACDVGPSSVRVKKYYEQLINEIGSEFFILLDAPLADISAHSSQEIANALAAMRAEKIFLTPGYDGVFGKISVTHTRQQQKLL